MVTPSTSGTNLKQPDPINWDNHNAGGTRQWVTPPAPYTIKPDGTIGERVMFVGITPRTLPEVGETKAGYRSFMVEGITVEKPPTAAGYKLRRVYVNVKGWVSKKTGKTMDVNSTSLYLRACGINDRPNTNEDYERAMQRTAGRAIHFTADWEARNSETGEEIKGYLAFPEEKDAAGNPTGKRKAILKAGDDYNVIVEGKVAGTAKVRSEVLFANLVADRFIDQSKK